MRWGGKGRGLGSGGRAERRGRTRRSTSKKAAQPPSAGTSELLRRSMKRGRRGVAACEERESPPRRSMKASSHHHRHHLNRRVFWPRRRSALRGPPLRTLVGRPQTGWHRTEVSMHQQPAPPSRRRVPSEAWRFDGGTRFATSLTFRVETRAPLFSPSSSLSAMMLSGCAALPAAAPVSSAPSELLDRPIPFFCD